MSKVREFTNQDGKHSGWAIFCPACEHIHLFDERWTFNGDMERPTFSPSMLVHEHPYGDGVMPRCHSFVTDGKIAYCGDSGHKLAGQTVDLPDYQEMEERPCIPCAECVKSPGCHKKKRSPAIIGCVKGIRPSKYTSFE
jgi:hypothetical protein